MVCDSQVLQIKELGRESSLQKAKTPAEMLALRERSTVLPSGYSTRATKVCQGKRRGANLWRLASIPRSVPPKHLKLGLLDHSARPIADHFRFAHDPEADGHNANAADDWHSLAAQAPAIAIPLLKVTM